MRIITNLAALLLAAAILLPGGAAAQLGVDYFSTDSVFDMVLSDTVFVAAGRIGDLSGTATFELSLGPSTVAPAMTAQHPWESAVAYPFTLDFDVTTRLVTFTLGGNTLTYVANYSVFDAIFIRVRAINADSWVGVYGLVLDGIDVPGSAVESGPEGLKIMQIYGAPLADGFTLTGLAKLYWAGTPPVNSELTFQIKVANMLVVENEAQSWGEVKNLFR